MFIQWVREGYAPVDIRRKFICLAMNNWKFQLSAAIKLYQRMVHHFTNCRGSVVSSRCFWIWNSIVDQMMPNLPDPGNVVAAKTGHGAAVSDCIDGFVDPSKSQPYMSLLKNRHKTNLVDVLQLVGHHSQTHFARKTPTTLMQAICRMSQMLANPLRGGNSPELHFPALYRYAVMMLLRLDPRCSKYLDFGLISDAETMIDIAIFVRDFTTKIDPEPFSFDRIILEICLEAFAKKYIQLYKETRLLHLNISYAPEHFLARRSIPWIYLWRRACSELAKTPSLVEKYETAIQNLGKLITFVVCTRPSFESVSTVGEIEESCRDLAEELKLDVFLPKSINSVSLEPVKWYRPISKYRGDPGPQPNAIKPSTKKVVDADTEPIEAPPKADQPDEDYPD